jgi:hypothetical protein
LASTGAAFFFLFGEVTRLLASTGAAFFGAACFFPLVGGAGFFGAAFPLPFGGTTVLLASMVPAFFFTIIGFYG